MGDCCGPFVPASFTGDASGGGGGVPGFQAFRYTVTGAEPSLSDFMVTLPVARANDTYRVQGTLAGVVVIVGIDLPDLVAGDRTTTQFRFVSTAPMTAGDQIDFLVSDVV